MLRAIWLKRRLPRAISRTINNDQRSPTTANASAIAQGRPGPALSSVISLGLHIKPHYRYRVRVPVWKSNYPRVRHFGVIIVVLTAVFMTNLDLWIVNVAFVDIQRELTVSLSTLSWVLNAYAVTLAAFLLPAGRLGDRMGHRQVFLLGSAVFTIASAACAASPDITALVLSRVVQAIGASLQLPTSLALLMAAAPPDKRMSAARGWSAVGALAAVAGPILGGIIVSAGSWRWVFLVNVPLGIIAWVVGRRILVRPNSDAREPLPDILGSLMVVVAVASLTAAIVQAPAWGWTHPATISLAALSVVAFIASLRRCATHAHPMIELALARTRSFAAANLAALLFSSAFAIMLLSNSLWCQTVWAYSALQTGLALAPGPAMVPLATLGSARLVKRYGAGPVAAVGCVLFGVSQLWRVCFCSRSPAWLLDVLPSMLIGGVGVGLTLTTVVAAAATALPAHRAATGSAVVNSVRQIASALGVAVLVTVLATSVGTLTGYRLGWAIAAGLAAAAIAPSLLITPRKRSNLAGTRLAAGPRLPTPTPLPCD